jgi:hypothetical protein
MKKLLGIWILALALIAPAACKELEKTVEKKVKDQMAQEQAKEKSAEPTNQPAGGEPTAQPGGVAVPMLGAAAVGAEYHLTAGANSFTVKRESENKWTLAEGGKTYAIVLGAAEHQLFAGGKQVATAKLKEDKLKVAGDVTFQLKFKADKIKLSLSEGGPEWDLKYKEDKVKVVKGETELGKVKYYPDKGKLKVKDAGEQELAVSRDIGGLTAAPAPLLIPELSPEQRDLIMLTLFAMNK